MIAAFALLLAQGADAANELRRGTDLVRANQLDQATAAFARAVALAPESAQAHLALGQAYFAKASADFLAQAKVEFQRARELDPKLTLASFYIAKIDIDLGRLSAADRELGAALKRRPGDPLLLALLGETRRRQGQPRQAVDLITQAVAAGGAESTPLLYYRAQAHRDLADAPAAVADLDRLEKAGIVTPDALLLRGSVEAIGGRHAEAERSLRRAIQLAPNLAEAHLRLAQALRRRGAHQEARAALDRFDQAPRLSSEFFETLEAEAAAERLALAVSK